MAGFFNTAFQPGGNGSPSAFTSPGLNPQTLAAILRMQNGQGGGPGAPAAAGGAPGGAPGGGPGGTPMIGPGSMFSGPPGAMGAPNLMAPPRPGAPTFPMPQGPNGGAGLPIPNAAPGPGGVPMQAPSPGGPLSNLQALLKMDPTKLRALLTGGPPTSAAPGGTAVA